MIARRAGTTRKDGTPHSQMPGVLREAGLRVKTRRNADLNDLRRAVKPGSVVIVNYFDLVDTCGHFAIVRSIGKHSMVLIDPDYGSRHRLPLPDFLVQWHNSTRSISHWFLVVSR